MQKAKFSPKLPNRFFSRQVGFPWLCADCGSEGQRRRCHRHRESGGDDGDGGDGQQRKLKPWNQALLVCRRWNALGVSRNSLRNIQSVVVAEQDFFVTPDTQTFNCCNR